MTLKQKDIVKRLHVVYEYLYESEQRCASEAVQFGRYNQAYKLVTLGEARKNG